MTRKRRLSPRQHAQRVRQRQAGTRGFDRGGGRRSIFRSKYAKVFYVVGIVGIVGSLVPLLLVGGGIGLGPLIAQAESAPDRSCVILNGARSQAGLTPAAKLPVHAEAYFALYIAPSES